MAFIVNPAALKVRQLSVKLTLQSGEFTQGNNQKLINNLTVNAEIHKTLSSNFTISADVIIYGMNKSDIAALSTTGYAPLIYEANSIEIFAQYEGEPEALCFSGFIVKAWAEFANPSRPMHFQCYSSFQDAINNVKTLNIKGTQSIPTTFNQIANNMGLSFNNNGVTGQLNNAILTGSYLDQLRKLTKQCNVNCVIDNNKLNISPYNMPLYNEILNINSGSGLLSYPVIDNYGVQFRMRFNSQLNIGQYIKLETSVVIPESNGQFYVYDMQISLNNRHENWYADIRSSTNQFQEIN